MESIMRALCILLATVFLASTAYAQDLTLFDAMAWPPPTAQAKFFAYDSTGQQQFPTVADVSVSIDGIPGTVLSVVSPPPTPTQALSTVLVFDIASFTASDTGLISNVILAKEAARTWIQRLVPYENQCAIIGFRGTHSLHQDFTFDTAKLLTATNQLQSKSSRSIQNALLGNEVSALRIARNGRYQKVIIVLTDGFQAPINATAIISEAQRQNCIIYVATIGSAISDSLKVISEKTGGKWFDRIGSVEQVQQVYRAIYYHAQGHKPSVVSWANDTVCFPRQRTVSLTWNGQSATASYVSSTVEFTPDKPKIFFHSKPLGQKYDTTVKFTAKWGDVIVTQITSSNPAFDINPKQFTVRKDFTQNLTISYTPTDSGYSWAKFTMQTDRCTRTYFASGGFPYVKTKQPTLAITNPLDSVLVAGSTVEIAWNGISPDDKITLEYSKDSGKIWKPIVRNASGGKYLWHIPVIESQHCFIRAQQSVFDNVQHPSQWPQRIGGPGYEFVSGIVADNSGNIFVVGESSGGITDFIEDTLKAKGGYLVKYSNSGTKIWSKRFSGFPPKSGKGIAVDNNGNVYIVGNFSNSIKIDNTVMTSRGGQDFFIAKFNSNGDLLSIIQDGSFNSEYANAIAIDKYGDIYITGSFYKKSIIGNQILISTGETRKDTLEKRYENIFIAKYHQNGNFLWVKQIEGLTASGADIMQGNGVYIDKKDNVILSGHFTGWISSEGQSVSGAIPISFFVGKFSRDGSTIWLRSYGSGHSYNFCDEIAIDSTNSIYASIISNFHSRILKYSTNGDFLWLKPTPVQQFRSNYGEQIAYSSIVSDKQGNVILSCSINEQAILGLDTLHRSEDAPSTLISKIQPDGDYEWSIIVGNKNSGKRECVTLDPSGNIVVAGGFYETGNFISSKIQAVNYEDVFVWQFNNITTHSAQSRKAFQITKPTATSTDIDFGNITAQNAKDTVIREFIKNSSPFPLTVVSMEIIGEQAETFSITSPPPPFTILPNSYYPAEFRFLQSVSGLRSAQIRIITQSDTLLHTIQGNVLPSSLGVIDSSINFGQVVVGRKKSLANRVQIINTGLKSETIIGVYIDSLNGNDFSISAISFPLILQPREVAQFTVEFSPTDVGITDIQLHFILEDRNSPLTIQLIGEGVNPYFYQLIKEIEFGEILAGRTRDTLQAITLKNISDSSIAIKRLLIHGSNSSDFSVKSIVPLSLQPQDVAKIDLRFIPLDVRERHSELFIEYDGVGSPIPIKLSGVGINPYLSIINPIIDFGTRRLFSSIDSLQIPTVTNIDTLPITVTNIYLRNKIYYDNDSVFVILNKSLPLQMIPGDTAKFDIQFNPNHNFINDILVFEYSGIGSPVEIAIQGKLDPRDYVDVPIADEKQNFCRISPNPAYNQAMLQLAMTTTDKTEILITDLLGQQVKAVYSGELTEGVNSISFNTDELAAGMYYVVVITSQDRYVQKLVVGR